MWCVRSDFQKIDSAFATPSDLFILSLLSCRFWTKQFSFFEISHLSMNCFGRSNLKSQNSVAIFTKIYQPYCFGDIVWSRKSNFAVFESFILFFYQYFLPKSYLKREKRVVEEKEICFRCCKKVPKCLVLPDWAKWEQSKFLTKKIQRHGWNKLRRNKVGIHNRNTLSFSHISRLSAHHNRNTSQTFTYFMWQRH